MKIPFEIKTVLTLPMIGVNVYPQFRKMGIDTIELHIEFIKAFKANKSDLRQVDYFLEYGMTVLNPILNKRLNRPVDHPTFLKLVEYGIRDIIKRDQSVYRKRTQLGLGAYEYGVELIFEQ